MNTFLRQWEVFFLKLCTEAQVEFNFDEHPLLQFRGMHQLLQGVDSVRELFIIRMLQGNNS